ncbi:hypothetical protein Q4544_10750 [Cognatishimia sp. 1_MG-2023]|uniref:hypothetical protein n=1 Tax=Cognatishimia sp. 1_MG-2023 TaxID=3062642 RepID=UPI0026E40229|nr:hypothetical protein [Cognatishimia sp. 1_MG-2023]MDO6727413.1 hypothetical protein [Cognatishimia sp. 1_MG-2023]
MNMNRLINMIVRQVIRKVVNSGVQAGAEKLSAKGNRPSPKADGKRARQAMRFMRRVSKF